MQEQVPPPMELDLETGVGSSQAHTMSSERNSQQEVTSPTRLTSSTALKLPKLWSRVDNRGGVTDHDAGNHTPKVNNVNQAGKQVFVPIACLPYEHNVVYCFILSAWDNIMGPQTVQVWKREPNPQKMSTLRRTEIYGADLQRQPSETLHTTGKQEPEDEVTQVSDSSKSILCENAEICIDKQSTATEKTLSFDTTKPTTLTLQPATVETFAGLETYSRERLSNKSAPVGRLASIVQYVTEHTVMLTQVQQMHHSSMQKLSPTILILPHLGIVVQALRFLVQEAGGHLVPHCLSLVVSAQEEEQLLRLSSLTGTYLIRTVRKLQLMLGKSRLTIVGSAMAFWLHEMCSVLVSLRRCSLAHYPPLPGAEPPPDRQMALRLLTAHLLTGGYTVVQGDTSTAVNKVLLWLSLFLQPADLHLSRLCVQPHSCHLQPGLMLQGVLGGTYGSFSASELLECGRSVAVCDLDTLTVRITRGDGSSDREVLREVTEVSGLAKQCLQHLELLLPHSAEVRRGYTRAFTRCLRYLALAALQWCTNHRAGDKAESRVALREVLSLDEPSLDIVLALARELQPGTALPVVR